MTDLYDSPGGAVFSPCRLWRYVLWRAVVQDMLVRKRGSCNFIMLNPSTADELVLDPTIRRCIAFSQAWGYSRLVVTNLFAWRATEPDDMKRALDPIGVQNDGHILDCAKEAAIVVCAWGNDGAFRGRATAVLKLLRDAGVTPHALKINTNGKKSGRQPAHPLYLKKTLRPEQIHDLAFDVHPTEIAA